MAVISLLLWSCAPASLDSAEPPHSEVQETALIELAAPRLFRRASLDLRGRLPSAEELDALATAPDQVDTQVLELMQSEEFEAQLVVALGERFLTILDTYEVRYSDYFLDESQSYTFHRSIGEEPLRLMARVVAEDRPWSDIVTTDQTMANAMLAQIWPIERESDESEWSWAHYTDGRPAAGILSTNGMWWRYISSPSNKNRGRVAAISRLLLCTDILSRPIQFAGSISLAEEPDAVLLTQPDCLACHATVEPIAAVLFGFHWYSQYSAAEMTGYHPEREPLGEDVLGVSAAWYGQPMEGLVDLGAMVSGDPRFGDCAVETVAEMLWHRDLHEADWNTVVTLKQVYEESDGRMRPVFEAVLGGNRYRAGGPNLDTEREHERTLRLMSPDQLAKTLEALTGFRWTAEGTDMLRNDIEGYRVLAGGVDGDQVTRLQQSPSLTQVMVQRRLAEAASEHAVTRWQNGEEVSVFEDIDPASGPSFSGFEDDLARLHWTLLAMEAEDEWIESMHTLFVNAEALSDTDGAWTVVLASLFQDPRFWSY